LAIVVAASLDSHPGQAILPTSQHEVDSTWSPENRRVAMAVFPRIAISLAVSGFNMLGAALRDVLDPKLGDGPLSAR
jgi:hypothetical protein